ncbi:hypothetical protein ACF1AJ_20645 [Leifsonia sp. NPDC014704]|uniref:hypothetical protein n=1 Tax=Leifsonia sp. NPDC014704 TaxID=3364123 RepID=UPI0036F45991
MEDKRPVERLAENRCASRGREKAGRTHLCKLTAEHGGDHYCICSKHWKTGVTR